MDSFDIVKSELVTVSSNKIQTNLHYTVPLVNNAFREIMALLQVERGTL
jgi:hypothetical protein